MDEKAALLQAIIASPEDNTVRLAFADWLDEHGEKKQARFIRVQIALHNGTPLAGTTMNSLKVEELALMPSQQNAFMRTLPKGCNVEHVTFTRGFASGLTLSPQHFANHAASLAALAPLESVRLADGCNPSARTLRAFLHALITTKVTTLHLGKNSLGAEPHPAMMWRAADHDVVDKVRALAEYLPRSAITSMHLGANMLGAFIPAQLIFDALPAKLETLDLGDDNFLHPAQRDFIAYMPLVHLKHLRGLATNGINRAEFETRLYYAYIHANYDGADAMFSLETLDESPLQSSCAARRDYTRNSRHSPSPSGVSAQVTPNVAAELSLA